MLAPSLSRHGQPVQGRGALMEGLGARHPISRGDPAGRRPSDSSRAGRSLVRRGAVLRWQAHHRPTTSWWHRAAPALTEDCGPMERQASARPPPRPLGGAPANRSIRRSQRGSGAPRSWPNDLDRRRDRRILERGRVVRDQRRGATPNHSGAASAAGVACARSRPDAAGLARRRAEDGAPAPPSGSLGRALSKPWMRNSRRLTATPHRQSAKHSPMSHSTASRTKNKKHRK
jgi:hypothetical protein